MRAWVIRWEWVGDHAAVEQPVVAILPPQTGDRQVRRIVEVLYAARQLEPEEMLALVRPKAHNPFRAHLGTTTVREQGREFQVPWAGEVYCGENPHLYARIADVTPKRDGSGDIDYVDRPRPEVLNLDRSR